MKKVVFGALVGALALTTVVLVGAGGAHAAWNECTPTHVAYNPYSGDQMRIGHAERSSAHRTSSHGVWVCVDDGGVTGAHSIGTAGYHNAETTQVRYLQHTVFCLDLALPSCTQAHTGAALYGIAAGPSGGGATGCTSLVLTYYSRCQAVSVGATSTAPASATTGNPSTGICGVDVNGNVHAAAGDDQCRRHNRLDNCVGSGSQLVQHNGAERDHFA